MVKAKITMDELLADEQVVQPAKVGEIIEGTVLSCKKHEILVDLGALGVGMVPRRETMFGRNLKEGDVISASVVDPEMKDGMVLLSLRKAVKEKGWDVVVNAKWLQDYYLNSMKRNG